MSLSRLVLPAVPRARLVQTSFDNLTWTSQLPWPHAPSTPSLLPPFSLSSFPHIPFSCACPHNSHLQPSLPWIILASARLAHVDHRIPNIPNNLSLQVLPLPTSINLHPLIVHTLALPLPLISTTVVITATMCLFKLSKEETGEPLSISPAEYDNTLLTRISCHLVPTPNLALQWQMLRS